MDEAKKDKLKEVLELCGDETEVVGEGDWPGYCEVSVGPWLIMYNRGNRGFSAYLKSDARFTIKGPFIEGNDEHDDVRDVKTDDEKWPDVVEMVDDLGGWDYVELTENPVHVAED